MVNIILFGPPGIGKSSIIAKLKERNVSTLDLEDLYPAKIRFQIPNMVDGKVLGGADLQPKRSYHNAVKVVLTLPQSEYEARRKSRDALSPDKGNQPVQQVSAWEGIPYATYITADDDVVNKIESIYRRIHEEKQA